MNRPATPDTPAFPSVCLNDPGHPSIAPGVDLRDYFAGQALAGMMASEGGSDFYSPEWAAERAYQIADAMEAQRQRTRK